MTTDPKAQHSTLTGTDQMKGGDTMTDPHSRHARHSATLATWRDALAAIDAVRLAAIQSGDVATLRTMLLRAMAFARHTIQRRTNMAEREYMTWLQTGISGGLYPAATRTTIESASRFVATLTIENFRAFENTEWLLAETIESNVVGLGVAKASFSAALFGMPECYCIDIWGTRHVMTVLGIDGEADKFRGQWSGRKNRWSVYREYGDKVFGNREGQWQFFESADPTFASGGHGDILASIINA